MMNIALTDDLQRLLRNKVDNGEFPNEESVVEEALKCFLIQGPSLGRRQAGPPIEASHVRLPGPFLEDQAALPPLVLPRSGQEVVRPLAHDATRRPTLFPGE